MGNNVKKYVTLALVSSFLLILAGCYSFGGGNTIQRSGHCYQQDFNKLLEHTELKKVFADIANELCVDTSSDCGQQTKAVCVQSDTLTSFDGVANVDISNNCGLQVAQQTKTACNENDLPPSSDEVVKRTVLVTDFVDIQSFVPKQQGILMGELMRGSLNSNCSYRIVQAEFAKYFKLSESGLVVLSRNVGVIKHDEYKQPECIVGTYSIMNNKLILFVRRINTDTGKISKMVTREITYSCSGKQVSYTIN